MLPSRKSKRRRWTSALAMLALAAVITVLIQQPAGSPPSPPSPQEEQSRASPQRLGDTQAERAAREIDRANTVEGVQVAVRHGVALIAVKPRPGLSPEEHRALERDIAGTVPDRVEGIDDVLVTTDPAMYESIQQLRKTQRDLERRVGTRTTESHILWAREFDRVAAQMQGLGSYARGGGRSARAASLPD